jgi:hypothetical protein
MLDGALAEVVKAAGGVNALAAELRISTQAVHKWNRDGIPEHRHKELAKLTGVPEADIASFSQQRRHERRANLEWWQPDSARPREEEDPLREAQRHQDEIERDAMQRDAWMYNRGDPRYPPPRADLTLPAKPVPPSAFAWFSLIYNQLIRVRDKHLIAYFARYCHDGGKLFYLYPQGTPPPHHLHKDGATGCWLVPETLEAYRSIARHFDLRESRLPHGGILFSEADEPAVPDDPTPPPRQPATPWWRQIAS